MNTRRIFMLAAAVFAACACFCSRDDNPFTNPSNARAVVSHASFADRDTVNIFTTETLQTMIAVRELVDSVVVVARNNRRGPDVMVVRSPSAAGPNTCLISFADTGWTTVSVATFRKDHDAFSTSFSLYCRSPLAQPAITGNYGDTVVLSSGRVGDQDVMYHWDFGYGIGLASPQPDTCSQIKLVSYDTVGWLWVSDPSGTHPSPKARFLYHLRDNNGPRIVCVNLPPVIGDTILTGDTTFYLHFKIWDPAQAMPVCSAKVNNQAFSINEDPYYIHVFGRMDTALSVFPVVVHAIDNQRFHNSSLHTFYLRFSDTMSHANGIVFRVIDPSTDSSTTQTKSKVIFGEIDDYSRDSICAVVKMWLNGAPALSPDTARGKFVALWSFQASLADGINQVRLVAYSMKGDSIAARTLQINYSPGKDTTPPVILEITADNRNVSSFLYTPLDTAKLRIIAFDEASGMKAVLLNGDTVPESPDGHGFIWYDTVRLVHVASGNIFKVKAVDKAANASQTQFTLFRNSTPEITRTPSFPDRLYVGQTYSDFLLWQDADNDPVTVTKIAGPSSVTAYQNGRIDFKPVAADTGIQTVTISLFDGYQSVEFSFRATVIGDTTNMPPQVRFATTLADFPRSLEVGVDSISMILKTLSIAANSPLEFSAALASGTSAIVLQDSVMTWRPVIADTGLQTLVLTVTDRYKRSDTLRPSILVVPPNRPCSLFVSSTIPVFNDGELDLSNATAPETLFFSVHDPDPAITEHLTALIRWPANESVIGIDSSRKFVLILNPKTAATKNKDTILVKVKDMAGHSDSLTFFISYVPEGLIFSCIRTLTINTSIINPQMAGNVFNFPLLVRLDKSFFPFDSAAHGGRDVRFRKPNGAPLPYQIESWDSAAGTAALWVLVDTVYANNGTQNLRMIWGNKNALDTSSGSMVFSTSNSFVGVWHFSKTALIDTFADATGSGFNLTNHASVPALGNNIASDRSFNGSAYLNTADNAALNITDQITLSAWAKLTNATQNQKIIGKMNTTYNRGYLLGVSQGTIYPEFYNSTGGYSTFFAGTISSGQWVHLAVTRATGGNIIAYVNGVPVNSQQAGSLAIGTSTNDLIIGSGPWNHNQFFINGEVDEVRIENAQRSADWIKLNYENQRQGSTVVTVH
jgi:hypothetical protein